MTQKEQFLRDWFRRVWKEEDGSVIHQMFVPDKGGGTAHGLQKGSPMGPQQFELFHQAILAQFKDINIEILSCIEQGDWVSARCFMTATSKSDPSRRPSMEGCVYVRIDDEKMREAYNFFDFINFFEEAGLLPDNTLQSCMLGVGLMAKAPLTLNARGLPSIKPTN